MSGCGAESGLISLDQALDKIIAATPCLEVETLQLQQGLHRYLAEDIYAGIDLPLFSQSAVDGYALCSDGEIAPGAQFQLVGEIRAGQSADVTLQRGQAMRIFTGAPIPAGTTTVARQEIVQRMSSHLIQLEAALKLHADIRDVGEEISQGQLLASAGQYLNIGAIAALSMAGIDQVQVYQQPKVAVLITGDEVAQSAADLQAGKIFDANAPLIAAWCQARHQPVHIVHVEDNEIALIRYFQQLQEEYDVIISTGGISVGDYDFIRPVALNVGFEQVFWKVKQKPGKPVFFARYRKSANKFCHLLALPGNPAAVYVGISIYTQTLLEVLQGQSQPPAWWTGQIQHDLKPDARERILRMAACFEDGVLKLHSLAKQQSHMLSNLMYANCLVRVPAHQPIQKGQCLKGIFIQH
ncbi:molybdopterin molybdotransferase MoeA [Acinetobacter indicus]|uniref:molybdopterin molybdotransferase MoeA n=1 Tax=Acinetobacter TaxID=469 RepID=UPI0015D27A1C|nr:MULTISPECIES: molybdopterin molybdotransferase MoeA [Acinetobacter]MCP0916347.1 molybdopterin molybdotransferase MoeA [Acinetobacter indicus]MCP0919472.1 molybdopterin molybdotransferase MoeA [Acinetobacter indicus]MCP0922139.1 molybdopterin molybdotransferase MoeA [Acinetobacter indicus]QSQ93529.1 molybdopterin molybdotransferase MoeA [Acinetobacter indicus]